MYTKQDAKMTKGLAIICMLVLHLFCRLGKDVYGTPLIWINETTPLVYIFGFFAEICVPLYSLAAGYAQELLREQGKFTWKDRILRILRLMETYWIVVILFSLIGLIKHDPLMPGNVVDFIKSLVLLHSYNGAWWFLHSYVLLLLLPQELILYPVKRLNIQWGGIICSLFIVIWYLMGKFDLRLSIYTQQTGIYKLIIEIENLIGIIPAVWFGGLMCRFREFDSISAGITKYVPSEQKRKYLFACIILILIIGFYIIHKAVLASFNAVVIFIIFNLWKKSDITKKIFRFLGNHSTGIWLTHMFFYLYMFSGLVQRLRLPMLMLTGLLGLSLFASFVVTYIKQACFKISKQLKKA